MQAGNLDSLDAGPLMFHAIRILPLFTSSFPVPRLQGSGSAASIIQETPQMKGKQARLALRLQPPSCRERRREGKKKILSQTTEPKPGRGASNVPVPFVTL